MASVGFCSHVDASGLDPVTLNDFSTRLFIPRHGSIHDNLTPREQLQLCVDLLRELFLECQLSNSLIDQLLRIYIPREHHHTIRPMPTADPRAFPQFRHLPPELRIAIWKMAAEEPQRVLCWGEYGLTAKVTCLNAAKDMAIVAQACKEAWDVVTAMGCYCKPPHPLVPIWVSSRDLVYVPENPLGILGLLGDAAQLAFLSSRQQLVVDWSTLVRQTDENSKFLRHVAAAAKLDTLICIVRTAEILVDGDGRAQKLDAHASWHSTPETPYRPSTRILHKLVMYDDRPAMEKLDALWRAMRPEWRAWIRPGCITTHHGPVSSEHQVGGAAPRCVDYVVQLWETKQLPRIKAAWLRMLLCVDDEPGNGIRDGRRILSPGGVQFDEKLNHLGRTQFDENHPWVCQALANMPRIKPAMMVTVVRERLPGV